ncbi:hypothetical protein ABZ635_13595 [Nocardiopsis sp. NPDC007018]|uniref:hypothetical protein n=1 Tax=Nocardiopsis sp. NPDC007018 TaxID=3155721 RepID=UPI0033F2BE28
METKGKAEAVDLAMARAGAWQDRFPAPLEFRVADTALADPDLPGAENGDVYNASATYACPASPRRAHTVLRALHSAWSSRGWESALRRSPHGGGVTAQDPEGFTYSLETWTAPAVLVLHVYSPLYRDPDPDTLFTPRRPG